MSKSKRVISAFSVESPKCVLVVAGIQFSCGRFSSGVSSIDTTFRSGLMNMLKQLSRVVLPAAIPPATRIETLFSTAYQKKAAISGERDLKAYKVCDCEGVKLEFSDSES